MEAFWDGMLAGFGIAIPVGAIALLIVDTGLRRGLSYAFMAGSGAAAADFFYATLAAVAGEALASTLAPYASALRFASALVLVAIGGFGLWRARQLGRRKPDAPTISSSLNHFRTFLQFLGLTLLNPLTVAYFGALILGRESAAAATLSQRVAFVAAAGLASLSWQTFLAIIGALAGRHLSPRFQWIATIGGNLVVIALGMRILVH